MTASGKLTMGVTLALAGLGLGCAPDEGGAGAPRSAGRLDGGASESASLSAICGDRSRTRTSESAVAAECAADPTPDLQVVGNLYLSRGIDAADWICVCEVSGTVTVDTGYIPNLLALSNLERADGLYIRGGRLTSLRGLRPGLELRTLRLANLLLLTLDGLQGITALESLSLDYLPYLSDLTGLDAVEEIGELELSALDRFDRFDGVPALRTIGRLRLDDNDMLDDFSGLEAVESIDAIDVEGGHLRDFSGLPEGLAVSSLRASAETQLVSVAPLTLAPTVTELRLSELRWLNDIGSLTGAAHIGVLSLDNLLELDEIDVLRSVSTMDSASVTNTPFLRPEDYSWLRGVATHGSTPLEVW